MSCKNCFNGCSETTSDQCVKYTGVTVESLGINQNDPYNVVIESIINNIKTIFDGTGLKFDFDSLDICDLISSELPDNDITLKDYLSAFIVAICSLESSISTNSDFIQELESDYDVECLNINNLESSSGTHNILQAVIAYVCNINTELSEFIDTIEANYLKIEDIGNYIDSEEAPMSSKMVPNTVVEYYGSLEHFDSTGAGIDTWEKIYLCNGQNNTPDKRGRVGVGITNLVGNKPFPPETDPTITGNPTYNEGTTIGVNFVKITVAQLPSHSHNNTVSSSISPKDHNHGYTGKKGTGWPDNSGDRTTVGNVNSYVIESQIKNQTLSVSTSITNASVGSNEAHTNIQPVLACYYIIYIP